MGDTQSKPSFRFSIGGLPTLPSRWRSIRRVGWQAWRLGLVFLLAPDTYAQSPVPRLEWLGVCTVNEAAFQTGRFRADSVGGLSGLDYDARRKIWYLVSDSHKGYQPKQPHFYKARLRIRRKSFTVALKDSVSIQLAPDQVEPEAIRVLGNRLIWSTEKRKGNYFVWTMDTKGKICDSIPYAPVVGQKALSFYDPADGTVEALALSRDHQKLWIAPERGFAEDRAQFPRAIRITRLDLTKTPPQPDYEFAYAWHEQDTIDSRDGYQNGISEILTTDDSTQLLLLERRWNGKQTQVRLFRVSASPEANILGQAIAPGQLVVGTEVLNLTEYTKEYLLQHPHPILKKIDNVEGMAWGPMVRNAKGQRVRSLAFVTDNNYSPAWQQTQIWVFGWIEP